MNDLAHRTRVGFLGAGPYELELLLELRDAGSIEVVGAYDADPRSPGLAMAEVIGIPAGSDAAALERLRAAEFVVLPHDRKSQPDAVRWAGGLRAELVSLPEARRRWSEMRAAPPPAPSPSAASGAAARLLEDAVDLSTRLQDRSELCDWLLNVAMRTVGANGGSLQILSSTTPELYLAAARGLSERLVRLGRHRVGEGISGGVAALRAASVLHGPRDERPRERGTIHASISLPLEDAAGLVGVLNVSSTVRGKRFGDEHLRALERLGPRLARLLRDVERFDPADPQLDLPRLLRRFDADAADLGSRLAGFCEHARAVFGAEAVALWLVSEDGEWTQVHKSEPRGDRKPLAVRRSDLETTLLEQRWIQVTETADSGDEDPVVTAVERALDATPERRSQILTPLEGLARVGVLALEFESLADAERCKRVANPAIGQLGFCIDASLRDERDRRRMQGFANVARALQRLATTLTPEALDAALASEAARLLGGRVAAVRRVDETRRTYSRPTTHGIETEALTAWRPLDARVTERTLAARRPELTTAGEEKEEEAARCSLVSVPVLDSERIVGVITVYDKRPRDVFDLRAFTLEDRDLLECLGIAAAHLLTSGGRAHLPPLIGGTGHPSDAQAKAGTAPAGETQTAGETAPAQTARLAPPAPIQPATVRQDPGSRQAPSDSLEAVLHDEIERAASQDRALGVSVLRFQGLKGLEDAGAEARARLAAAVRLGLRGVDVVRWSSDEEMTIVGQGLGTAASSIEERLATLLRSHLARLGRTSASGLALRIGSSAYPADASDASGLLAAAASRVH